MPRSLRKLSTPLVPKVRSSSLEAASNRAKIESRSLSAFLPSMPPLNAFVRKDSLHLYSESRTSNIFLFTSLMFAFQILHMTTSTRVFCFIKSLAVKRMAPSFRTPWDISLGISNKFLGSITARYKA